MDFTPQRNDPPGTILAGGSGKKTRALSLRICYKLPTLNPTGSTLLAAFRFLADNVDSDEMREIYNKINAGEMVELEEYMQADLFSSVR